jgi:MFS family permease
VLFCINGALLASFLPRLPTVKAELGLTNTALGAGIAFGPVGALLASSVAGWLVARFGSGRLGVAACVAYGASLPLLGLAPTWVAFAAVVFVYGAFDAVADVAQNAHGLRVQHAYGRSLINGFHAWWSIGGVVGGVSAAGAAALAIPLTVHLATAGGILAVAALVAGRWTLPGPDPGANHAAPSGDPRRGRAGDVRAGKVRTRPRPALLTLGGVAGLTLLMAVVEDVPGTWGAVYLHDELGATAGVAGLAFAAFTAGMTAGRLVADRGVDRWGHVAVVRFGAAIAAAGLAGALLIGSPWSGLVGFVLVGLGASPGFPALFHAAGHHPGVRPADGVALVSWSGRAGFLIAPPVVGVVADASSLTVAVGLGVLAAIGVLAGASALRPTKAA